MRGRGQALRLERETERRENGNLTSNFSRVGLSGSVTGLSFRDNRTTCTNLISIENF